MTSQAWDAGTYVHNAGFVASLGVPVAGLLDPKPGERILDLGCGDGALTKQIADLHCTVTGVDGSADMVRAAQERGLDAAVMDGHALPYDGEFDAVFSNAALHWMTRPDEVLQGVYRALKPGGRFVAEMGGHGNVAAIVVALHEATRQEGVDPAKLHPWYFPSPQEQQGRLERAGFTVASIELIPRPTLLPTGFGGWFETFAGSFTAALPEERRKPFAAKVEAMLAPALRDSEGRWIADYVRLRFVALKR